MLGKVKKEIFLVKIIAGVIKIAAPLGELKTNDSDLWQDIDKLMQQQQYY